MPEQGCYGQKDYVDGIVTEQCPVMWYGEMSSVFAAFNWMERGFLPYAGGWAEQPALLLDALEIVIEEVEEERLRQQRAAAKQQS